VGTQFASALGVSLQWWAPSVPPPPITIALLSLNLIGVTCAIAGRRHKRVGLLVVILAGLVNAAAITTTATFVAYQGLQQCTAAHSADDVVQVQRSYNIFDDTVTCTIRGQGGQTEKIRLRPWKIIHSGAASRPKLSSHGRLSEVTAG
jgi:hypothetical protein